jgi:hypothetical protein
MAHIDNGVLVADETEAHTTADSEFANGRLDAHLCPEYARQAAALVAADPDPSFAARHWLRGALSVLEA